jgi:rRNA-processing protein FCF1
MLLLILDTNVLLANLNHLTAIVSQQGSPHFAVCSLCQQCPRRNFSISLLLSAFRLPSFLLKPPQVKMLIPWAVIEELDHLKDSGRVCETADGQVLEVAQLARRAAR